MAQLCLNWNSYKDNVCTGLSSLQAKEEFVDMTLAADGHFVKVHQMVVSLASPYLKELIKSAPCAHPVIFLNKISYPILCYILEYIYSGEVLVNKEYLSDLIEAGQALHIKGLQDMVGKVLDRRTMADLGVYYISPQQGLVISEKSNVEVNVAQSNPSLLVCKLQKYKSQSSKDVSKGTSSKDFVKDETMLDPFNDCANTFLIDDDDLMDRHSDSDNNDVKKVTSKTEVDDRSQPTRSKREAGSSVSDTDRKTLQYALSNRGSLQLVLNRFVYCLRYVYKNSDPPVRQWRCADYEKNRCPATVTTKDDMVVQRVAAHKHPLHDKKIIKKMQAGMIFSEVKEAESKGNLKKMSSADIKHKYVRHYICSMKRGLLRSRGLECYSFTSIKDAETKEEFVDMTLAADGHFVKVHQMIISLASPYLKELIKSAPCSHPVIFLNKISYPVLCCILEYIYSGEVLVNKDNLNELIEASKSLHIKGLEDMSLQHSFLKPDDKYSEESNFEVKAAQSSTSLVERLHKYRSRSSKDISPERHIVTVSENASSRDHQIEDDNISDPFTDCGDTFQENDDEDDPMNNGDTKKRRRTNDDIVSLALSRSVKSTTVPESTVPDTESKTVQYTLSNQGSLQLVLNRFIYFLRYVHKNADPPVRQWRCVDYIRTRCPASVTTKNDIVVQRINAHKHPFHDKKIVKKMQAGAIFTAIKDAETEGKQLIKKNANKDSSKDNFSDKE